MKRFAALLILAGLLLGISSVFAQEEDDSGTTIIRVPDVLVLCPGESVLPAVRAAAELVVEFTGLTDVISIPYGQILETENGRVLEIGRIELSCESTEADVAQIDRSASFGVATPIPQPENPTGLAQTQAGYLIVNTGSANLRSCDNPDCSRVGIVNGGDELIVIGRNEDTSWWFVQVGEVRGWIWEDLVIIRGDLSGTAIVETEGEATPPSVYIGYTGNLLYDVLSESGQAICNVQAGEYPLLARNGDTSWLWIEADCTDGRREQGWINASAVAIRNTGRVFVPIVGIFGPDSE